MKDTEGIDLGAADVFAASVMGDSLPQLKARALDPALVFYGPAARLELLEVRDIHSRRLPDERGISAANVWVRCLNLDEAEAAQECIDLDDIPTPDQAEE